MNRRIFIKSGLAAGTVAVFPIAANACSKKDATQSGREETVADLVIIGGGLGACAAALGALRNGLSVVMTEETDWIGGQLTQQGVPPDEHQYIETKGATRTYRLLRNNIRNYYRYHYPLTAEARAQQYLNPGAGSVSRLCHEPKVALAVLNEMLSPYIHAGKLDVLYFRKAVAAVTDGDKVKSVTVKDVHTGDMTYLQAPCFIDGTELGDLLPLTGAEFVTGTESQSQTGELHAPAVANPDNQQCFTLCFALEYDKGKDHTIQKPEEYDFWRNYTPPLTPPWPGKLLSLQYSNPYHPAEPKTLGFHPEGLSTGDALNLWIYRRIVCKTNFEAGWFAGDISLINWPQNDYPLGNLDGSEDEFKRHVACARQLNLSLLYWLQTEAPRPDGGYGWRGLRLSLPTLGTDDGMAKYPYVREARRIKAEFTVLEEHIGKENRRLVSGQDTAAEFKDSAGVGLYRIDLHFTPQGVNYLDVESLPFRIPLGALIPQRIENLLPACKNLGVTHITNGCFRVHPAEWNIGEAAGELAAFALKRRTTPRTVRNNPSLLSDFQNHIRRNGIETQWNLS
ncbi:MAG: FAD-dependent oxidoreductase [Bacteroidales bacterium]|jgi:hypothetical protein|nr:FAD-dependent oxidoreductase [Bacteroidales bacterium]